MIMRYPTVPSHPDDAEDIFFRLGQRQLSKLFRPKPSLCEHPMTLAVGSTIFCCRAILLEDTATTTTSTEDHPNNTFEENIELFSVVVALAPQERGPVVPITGWFEEQTSTEKKDDDDEDEKTNEENDGNGKTSPSFKTVRRVHLSLARLCRVLEREEKRCSYVSKQSGRYLALRKQMRAEASSAAPSPTSVSSTNKPPHIRRTSTFSSIFEKDSVTTHQISLPQGSQPSSSQQEQAKNIAKAKKNDEMEQEILEIFMTSETSGDGSSSDPMHRGNLARELVQFHHALARNDYNFPPSPSLLLTGRDGIVHINGHIAVAVEAVSPRIIQEQEVRPYETLLFPHASPKELLKSLAGYGSSASRRLQQVLLTVNPQKSLIDIASDANLSLQSSMEIARYVVSKSAAIVSPVISRSCRFACDDIHQLHDIALPFTHAFGAELDLFSLVSFLTQSSWTLEEAITNLLTSADASVLRLRVQLSSAAALIISTDAPEGTVVETPMVGSDSLSTGIIRDHNMASMEDLEDTLFQLTVWLCSHRVLVHLNEYLVATASSTASSSSERDERMEQKMAEKDLSSDEALFQELMELDCLTGSISLPACSWRIGIDIPRLRAFAERHAQIRVVHRPFQVGDDWGRLFD